MPGRSSSRRIGQRPAPAHRSAVPVQHQNLGRRGVLDRRRDGANQVVVAQMAVHHATRIQTAYYKQGTKGRNAKRAQGRERAYNTCRRGKEEKEKRDAHFLDTPRCTSRRSRFACRRRRVVTVPRFVATTSLSPLVSSHSSAQAASSSAGSDVDALHVADPRAGAVTAAHARVHVGVSAGVVAYHRRGRGSCRAAQGLHAGRRGRAPSSRRVRHLVDHVRTYTGLLPAPADEPDGTSSSDRR